MMPWRREKSNAFHGAVAMALHGEFYLSGKNRLFRERFGEIIPGR